MRSSFAAIATVTVAATQLACDPIYGLSRGARLPTLPQLDCVERAIRSVPGVTGVRRWEEEGSRPLTLTGIKPPDRVYYFSYERAETGAAIYMSENYKGEVEYSQHLIQIGQAPPQEHIDEIRPVMIQIEAALENQCDVRALQSAIEEYCSGVTCEAQ